MFELAAFIIMIGVFIWAGKVLYEGIVKPIQNKVALHQYEQADKKVFEEATKPRDPNNPPTPEESKNAHNLLRVSNAYYDDAFKGKDANEQLGLLTRATRELMKARAIDPTVTLTTTQDGQTLTETIDDVSAKYVYLESLLCFKQGEAMSEAENQWMDDNIKRPASERESFRSGLKVFKDRRTKYYREALAPAERAVTYKPNSCLYLRHLSQVYSANGNAIKAKEAIQRALAIDPDDIENLKISTSMR